jgi:hypothetical protein
MPLKCSNASLYADKILCKQILDATNSFGLVYDLDVQMKAKIWAGVFTVGSMGSWGIPSYCCATGNCTCDGYPFHGVCSRCANIMTRLNKNCYGHAANLNNVTGCDVTLPNGFSLSGLQSRRDHLTAVSTDYAPLIYGNYSDSLAVIQAIDTLDDMFFVNQSTPLHALECVMISCVIKYSESGVLNSKLFAKYGVNIINYYENADKIYNNFHLVDSSRCPSTQAAITRQRIRCVKRDM